MVFWCSSNMSNEEKRKRDMVVEKADEFLAKYCEVEATAWEQGSVLNAAFQEYVENILLLGVDFLSYHWALKIACNKMFKNIDIWRSSDTHIYRGLRLCEWPRPPKTE